MFSRLCPFFFLALATATNGSPTCNAKQMQLDVVLMLDSSTKVAQADFRKLTTYLGNLFGELNISPSGTRVAICGNFATDPIAFVNLKQSSDIGHLRSVLNTLPYAGAAHYGITLNSFWSWGISTFGNRAEAADVMIVFSASPLGGYDPVYPLKDFRAGGGRVVTVALGGLAAVELAPLASADRYATAVADYDHLHGHTDFLLNSMCDASCWPYVVTHLSAPSAAFHSALYPNDYCNNFISYHHMISPAPMRLHMRIPQFSLANGDHANVHNGLYINEIKENYHGVQNVEFRGTWNEMTLHLETDQSATAQGFSGAYQACMPGIFTVCAPFVAAKSNLTMSDSMVAERKTQSMERVFAEIVSKSTIANQVEQPETPETKDTSETVTGSYCNIKANSWDLVLMLDSMSDISETDFHAMIDFLRFTFFPQFVISQTAHPATRVGITVPFDHATVKTAYIDLKESTDLTTLQNALKNIPYIGQKIDHVTENSYLSAGMFTSPSHNRPEAADVIMFFTAHTLTSEGHHDPHFTFADFKQNGGRVIGVAIGPNVAASDLTRLTSPRQAFHVDRAAELANINVDLLNALCDDLCYPAANALLTAPTGTLSTPAYPNAYCNNLDANYLISLPTPLTADARIPRLQSEECCDFLHVFGGANLAQPRGSYSGDKREIRYRSSNGNAYFHFTTDHAHTDTGFEVNYNACMPGIFTICAT